VEVYATAVTASQSIVRWSAQRAYNGKLLQLLRALTSGSIVPFVLVLSYTLNKAAGFQTEDDILL